MQTEEQSIQAQTQHGKADNYRYNRHKPRNRQPGHKHSIWKWITIGTADTDRRADNLGIGINIVDVDRRADNPGTGTSTVDAN